MEKSRKGWEKKLWGFDLRGNWNHAKAKVKDLGPKCPHGGKAIASCNGIPIHEAVEKKNNKKQNQIIS